MSDILGATREKMEKVVGVVAEDMATIRVGAANPRMVENVTVEAYGQKMRLVELASISAPDPNSIVISPWDKNVIGEIEKGINESGLGLTANVNGEIVRIVIPQLTEERRKDYVKLVHQKLESGRVMVRGVRQEGRDEVDKHEDDAGISEDDVKRWLEELDKLASEYTEKIEAMARAKEEEVMRV